MILKVDPKNVVLAASDCARLALRCIADGDDRPRLAIEAAESWACGNATIEQVRSAHAAAGQAVAKFVAAANAPVASAAHAAAHVAAIVVDSGDIDAAAHAAESASVAIAAERQPGDEPSSTAERLATLLRCSMLVRRRIEFAEVLRAYAKTLKD